MRNDIFIMETNASNGSGLYGSHTGAAAGGKNRHHADQQEMFCSHCNKTTLSPDFVHVIF